ncbi:tonB-system energizer ExbB [Janthinobacterium agaricidamnosum]|uniref:Biopolymer transport protein ExbB n=1 Tax=Janthinobacterium agaricidamnosum NBRC 102515 = DSM 9628 TaxID=1349767 RepID=W0V504_9BURK|nr:tonB-system energizer ExbB [Janthinobacterium agaricidamnosum]CDG82357.1 motA/TolQ/ExbB proton channel family protein [Janthinobacterium agaricidamnosum NBRC 102515 = DSM 9628]
MNPTHIAAHLSPLDLFQQADIIVKSILVVLALASLASWGVIIDKLLRLRRLQRSAAGFIAALAGQPTLHRLVEQLRQHGQDPFARIYQAIADEWQHSHRLHLHADANGRDSLKERLNRVGQIASHTEAEQLQKGLSILATVGSVAPFVGLFGTVWGIMNAFQGIAASNSTSLAVVAPGIAEALFATALGLVAAIPAVVAYNRVAGDLNSYTGRLATLTGLVEVQLSRQLEAGETRIDSGDAAPLKAEHGHGVAALTPQGA